MSQEWPERDAPYYFEKEIVREVERSAKVLDAIDPVATIEDVRRCLDEDRARISREGSATPLDVMSAVQRAVEAGLRAGRASAGIDVHLVHAAAFEVVAAFLADHPPEGWRVALDEVLRIRGRQRDDARDALLSANAELASERLAHARTKLLSVCRAHCGQMLAGLADEQLHRRRFWTSRARAWKRLAKDLKRDVASAGELRDATIEALRRTSDELRLERRAHEIACETIVRQWKQAGWRSSPRFVDEVSDFAGRMTDRLMERLVATWDALFREDS